MKTKRVEKQCRNMIATSRMIFHILMEGHVSRWSKIHSDSVGSRLSMLPLQENTNGHT